MLSLEQALAALPGTADAIAAHLAALGIRGERKDGRCCPMANYLSRLGFEAPFVQPDYVEASGETLTFPPELREFVDRIDDGEWPELVAEMPDDDTNEPTSTSLER